MRSLILAALIAAAPATAADPLAQSAAQLRDRAARDNVAWSLVEDLTTEVGPRLAGTPAEARARDWAVARLKALGFARVRIEPFTMRGWERGTESAEVLGPSAQRLHVTALGYSGATPPGGIEAEVIGFESLAALKAAAPEQVKGRIVFVTHRMMRTQDGSSYGAFGAIRREGPGVAAARGAAAILIRSIGTSSHRFAHTGAIGWPEGVAPIAAGALSAPDAEQLERLAARGPVRLKLTLTPRFAENRPSGNVIAELPGSDLASEIVVAGGHLDSWDLGTGAVDDGAGVAITVAAAKAIIDAGLKPRRTIRIILWGAEEQGGIGGDAYAAAHAGETHVLAGESDFGAGRVWSLGSQVAESGLPAIAQMAELLAPLGVAPGSNDARAGTDVQGLVRQRVATVSPRQDGRDYFDIHHTADDTLDKIDRAALDQNVAAWAVVLWVAANTDARFGPVER